MIKKIFNWLSKKDLPEQMKALQPLVVSQAHHNLESTLISKEAIKVLKKLNRKGYDAYLVGGSVRDGLLEKTPKDFDVVTNAEPEQVRRVFSNCRLIGKRFRLAHIYFGSYIIEVATYRAAEAGQKAVRKQHAAGVILRDNVYGKSVREDALRRDFTVNALFYDLKKQTVIDYVGGISDLHDRKIKLIGHPETRYQEDPVRMLRAVRFCAKLDFTIDPPSEKPIFELGALLEMISPARLFEEYIKLFLKGEGVKTFDLLRKYQLLQYLFPALDGKLKHDKTFQSTQNLVLAALNNTDKRVQSQQPVSPGFLIAIFLWPTLESRLKDFLIKNPMSIYEARFIVGEQVLKEQKQHLSIPKRLVEMIKGMWFLQDKLCLKNGRQVGKIAHHAVFRAGYDLLLLRSQAKEHVQITKWATWWTEYNHASQKEKKQMVLLLKKGQ
jgi:poly(A) polymerase